MFRRGFSRARPRPPRNHTAPREVSRYIHKAALTDAVPGPAPVHRFLDFAIDRRIQDNIIARGYTAPTPIQDQAIPYILSGRDVVGVANTGTGKTAAFLIPLVHKITINRSERVLIVVPTRELGVQIHDELQAFSRQIGVSSALCIGGVGLGSQIGAVLRKPSFLIGTPGRLKDLIQRRILHLGDFRTVVLDEVDRMVDIGFIHDIRYLISLLPEERQSLFFSATVSPDIQNIIRSFLRNHVTVSVKVQETAAGIDQDVIRVASKEEKVTKLDELLRQDDYTKVLVFVRTKWNAERLTRQLDRLGIGVAAIHGNKSQNQRLRALDQFKRSSIQVLVATDVAARGLDIDSVSHVINFDEPGTYDDYIHRIGRTGRAQKTGKALTFVL